MKICTQGHTPFLSPLQPEKMFKIQHPCSISALKTYVTSRIFIHAFKDSSSSNAADSIRNCVTYIHPLCGHQIKLNHPLLLIQNFLFIVIVFQVHSIHINRKCRKLILKLPFRIILLPGKSFMQHATLLSKLRFFFLLETSKFWSLQMKKGLLRAQQYNCLQCSLISNMIFKKSLNCHNKSN